MMTSPTDADRVEALRRPLSGLASVLDANQLVADIADLHVRHNTFPGEVFMELADDALAQAGVERAPSIEYRTLLSSHLAEVTFRGTGHRRIQCRISSA